MTRRHTMWGLALLMVVALFAAACAADPADEAAEPDPADEAEPDDAEDEQAEDEEAEDVADVESRTLRLATIRTTADPTTQGADHFAELVEERTGGAVTVDVFPDSQLGDFTDIFAGMQIGEVDMFYEGISIYPTVDGAEAFLVTSVPFIWDSYDQMLEVMASDYYQDLYEEAADATGVRVIATRGDKEPRALSANRPIETAEDMQGLSIRIAEAPLPQAFASVLGAQAEVIPFSDLYLALQQGVVDAQENGAISMVTQSFYEVQDYFMPTDYIRDIDTFYISDEIWQDLEPELQEVMEEAAIEAGDLVTERTAEQLDEAMEALEAEIDIIEPDIESFRDALDGAFEDFDGDLWPEGTLDETRRLAEEAG
ncbi:MAG: TRAP transporter substrate-binding protein [Euzebyales bacterium]|nr:TRAP transporter substrate-binding protein [Euzebyales bacterium]